MDQWPTDLTLTMLAATNRGSAMTDQIKFAEAVDQETDDGVVQGGRPHVEFNDDRENEHRAAASRVHRSRWWRQARQSAFAGALFVLAPVFWMAALWLGGVADIGPMRLPAADFGLLGAIGAAAMAVLPVVVLGWFRGWLVVYRIMRDQDWQVAENQSDAREPRTSAFGFMRVFRLYARTKRRAVFVTLFGVVALWWAATAVYALVAVGGLSAFTGGAGMLAVGATALSAPIIAGLAMSILYVGYDISRRYVPGKILVRKTLILSMLATTSQTHYSDAERQAKELEADQIDEDPSLFYSYPKRPKGR